MTANKLMKLCAAAGIAFGVTACNSVEKSKVMDLAIAKTHSKSLLDQGVGQALAEEASPAAARIGRDVRALAVGKDFTKCTAKVVKQADGQSVVTFPDCMIVMSRAEATTTPAGKPSAPAVR